MVLATLSSPSWFCFYCVVVLVVVVVLLSYWVNVNVISIGNPLVIAINGNGEQLPIKSHYIVVVNVAATTLQPLSFSSLFRQGGKSYPPLAAAASVIWFPFCRGFCHHLLFFFLIHSILMDCSLPFVINRRRILFTFEFSFQPT